MSPILVLEKGYTLFESQGCGCTSGARASSCHRHVVSLRQPDRRFRIAGAEGHKGTCLPSDWRCSLLKAARVSTEGLDATNWGLNSHYLPFIIYRKMDIGKRAWHCPQKRFLADFNTCSVPSSSSKWGWSLLRIFLTFAAQCGKHEVFGQRIRTGKLSLDPTLSSEVCLSFLTGRKGITELLSHRYPRVTVRVTWGHAWESCFEPEGF